MKYLLKEGLIDGSCLTVTGKTIAENLEDVPDLNFEEQDIIYPLENPLKNRAPSNLIRKSRRERKCC